MSSPVLPLDASFGLAEVQQKFRESLPPAQAREAWISETTLEYFRLRHLSDLGFDITPAPDSLLAGFIKVTCAVPPSSAEGSLNDVYRQVFGHAASYVWTTNREILFSGTVDDGQPSSA